MENNVKFGMEKMWRWKWWILLACAVAAAVSIMLVRQMHDEFKSTAAFVPPSFTSLGTMVFSNGVAYRGFYAADEEDIDRTVAFLESKEVIDQIARKFNLYAHYGIDSASVNAHRRYYDQFKGNVKISFASNSVVEIECWDTDPEVAKNIADYYLEIASGYFETVSQRQVGLAASEKQLMEVEEERQLILDSLARMREQYKIYHLDHAGEEITRILAEQMRKEPMFHKYYDAVHSMETYISTLELRYGDLRREVMARQLNMEQYPSLIWITEHPSKSEFKDRPKRSIIVVLAVLGTLVFASFLTVVLDRTRASL